MGDVHGKESSLRWTDLRVVKAPSPAWFQSLGILFPELGHMCHNLRVLLSGRPARSVEVLKTASAIVPPWSTNGCMSTVRM